MSKFKDVNKELRAPKVGRIRHIKPEMFEHVEWAEMTIYARYAGVGSWTRCDKHGRFDWHPKSLKHSILPFDDVDFESLMNEWVDRGFVERYEVDGHRYGQWINWSKHQAINLRERDAAFEYPAPPAPDRNTATHVSDTNAHVRARAMSEGKGKGKDKGESKGLGEGESHSILHPANEGTNDPRTQPASLKILEAAFSEATGGIKLRAGKEQKQALLALVETHGIQAVSDAVERFGEDTHDWSQIACPAAVFLSHPVEAYIG